MEQASAVLVQALIEQCCNCNKISLATTHFSTALWQELEWNPEWTRIALVSMLYVAVAALMFLGEARVVPLLAELPLLSPVFLAVAAVAVVLLLTLIWPKGLATAFKWIGSVPSNWVGNIAANVIKYGFPLFWGLLADPSVVNLLILVFSLVYLRHRRIPAHPVA
jgi:hypothetical protein